jgi:ankyrin repeat/BTB/POZ domain-containing protein 1
MHDLQSRIQKQQKESLALAASKPGTCVNIISVEPDIDTAQLSIDFGLLASLVMGGRASEYETMKLFPDLCIHVDDEKYYCHKVFLCGRSEYFRALLTGHFSEAICLSRSLPLDTTSEVISEVTLHDVSATVFGLILKFIYSHQVDVSPEFVYPLLSASDMYLLPGLAKVLSVAITPYLTENNVIDILAAARLFNVPRLEMQCAQVIAAQLEKIIDNEDLSVIVREEAETIRTREETDSIPLVDDIRFHITNNSAIPEEVKEYKLSLLDSLLNKLGVEC